MKANITQANTEQRKIQMKSRRATNRSDRSDVYEMNQIQKQTVADLLLILPYLTQYKHACQPIINLCKNI